MLTYSDLVNFVKGCGIRYVESPTLRKGAYGFYSLGADTITIDPTLPVDEKISTLLHEYGHHVLLSLPYMKGEREAEWFAILFSLQTLGMFGGSPNHQLNLFKNHYNFAQATEPEKRYVLQEVCKAVNDFCFALGTNPVVAL